MLNYVPSDSVAYHIQHGDFERWIREVLKDDSLADEVSKCQNRIELIEVADRKRKELRSRLK